MFLRKHFQKIKYILIGIAIFLFLLIFLKGISIFQFYQWQKKRKALLIELLGVNPQTQLDPKSVKELEEKKLENGLIRKKISFKSNFDQDIPCYFFYYPKKEPQPGVLVISGHGAGIIETSGIKTETNYQNSNALSLAKAGFSTLTCENRGQGELKQEDIEQKDIAKKMGVKSYPGLLVADQLKALDYLYSSQYVNNKKIAAAGISLGGEIVMYLGVIDKRIKSTVVMGWLTNWTQLYDDKEDWKVPQIEGHFPSMADIGILIAPRHSLYHNGEQEGKAVIGVGFPADVAKIIHNDIKQTYHKLLIPSRTQFQSLNIEHEFVNRLAIDYLNQTFSNIDHPLKSWLTKDLPILVENNIKPLIGRF